MVRPARIELAALRLGGVRSIQLSYGCRANFLAYSTLQVKEQSGAFSPLSFVRAAGWGCGHNPNNSFPTTNPIFPLPAS